MELGFLWKKTWKFITVFVFVFIVSSLLFYAFEYQPEKSYAFSLEDERDELQKDAVSEDLSGEFEEEDRSLTEGASISKIDDQTWEIAGDDSLFLVRDDVGDGKELKVYEKRDPGYSGPDDLFDSFWYGIVTLSTVGYGDRFPVTTGGKIAAFFLIIFTFTFLGALIGMVSDAVMEARRREELGMDGTKFRDHIVLCGWSGISKVCLEELLAAGQRVAVITDDQDDIPKIKDLGNKKNLYTVFGEYNNKNVLNRSNIEEAGKVIVATGDDTENLVTSLTIKNINPEVRLIVSITNDDLKHTFYSAGVTYVASPSEMSGRMMASAAFEPEVALFVEDITTAAVGYDIQQYSIPEGSKVVGMTVDQFRTKLHSVAGPLLIGIAKYKPVLKMNSKNPQNWELIPNPDPSLRLGANDIVIALGNDKQNAKLGKLLNTEQGR